MATSIASPAHFAVPENYTGSASDGARAATNDRRRSWIWWFLAILAASQLYFVRELVAAFALFAIVFAAITAVVVTFYLLQKSWELAVARLALIRQPAMQISPVPHDTGKPA